METAVTLLAGRTMLSLGFRARSFFGLRVLGFGFWGLRVGVSGAGPQRQPDPCQRLHAFGLRARFKACSRFRVLGFWTEAVNALLVVTRERRHGL